MENDYIIKEIKKLKKVVQGIAYILKVETNMETNIDNKEHNIVLTEEQLASLTIMKCINEGNIRHIQINN